MIPALDCAWQSGRDRHLFGPGSPGWHSGKDGEINTTASDAGNTVATTGRAVQPQDTRENFKGRTGKHSGSTTENAPTIPFCPTGEPPRSGDEGHPLTSETVVRIHAGPSGPVV